jgi:ketosteroid isomerase-like protein
MSDNVSTIRGAYDAFGRGDIPGVIGLLANDVAWESPEILPHGGSFHGHDGAMEFFQGIGAKWEELKVDPQTFLDGGAEVVVLGKAVGSLRNAGAADYGFAHVFTFDGGKVTSFREYVDPGAAIRG